MHVLVEYIKLVLLEVDTSHNAHVADQLTGELSDDDPKKEDIDEFSGAGAIAGYTVPLGMSGDDLGRKKNSSKKKNKYL